jgi:hypothetical protein
VNLIDEEDIVLLEIREDRRQISGMGEHEAGGRPQRGLHFLGDDVGNRRLPQAWWTVENGVIERLASLHRCIDADAQRLFHPLLSDVVIERLRPQHVFYGYGRRRSCAAREAVQSYNFIPQSYLLSGAG